MKSSYGWKDGYNGNNLSGFNGLPSGWSDQNDSFWDIGVWAFFWSSNEYTGVFSKMSDVIRLGGTFLPQKQNCTAESLVNKADFYSVRCVKY